MPSRGSGERETGMNRAEVARTLYRAFAAGDRERVEAILSADLRFSSPADVGLDRAGYFERCWPAAGGHQLFDFVRVIEDGDAVVVTYEQTAPDGTRGRNTEVLTFAGDRVREIEVYFGWSL
jgi:hypothetical protein